jgi:hypothetical protein
MENSGVEQEPIRLPEPKIMVLGHEMWDVKGLLDQIDLDSISNETVKDSTRKLANIFNSEKDTEIGWGMIKSIFESKEYNAMEIQRIVSKVVARQVDVDTQNARTSLSLIDNIVAQHPDKLEVLKRNVETLLVDRCGEKQLGSYYLARLVRQLMYQRLLDTQERRQTKNESDWLESVRRFGITTNDFGGVIEAIKNIYRGDKVVGKHQNREGISKILGDESQGLLDRVKNAYAEAFSIISEIDNVTEESSKKR